MKTKLAFIGAALFALAGCEAPYDHVLLSSGGDSLPRLVQRDDHAATLRHGAIARVLPLVYLQNGRDENVEEGDLVLRSHDPEVVRVDPGRDPVEFYLSGAKRGTARIDVIYHGRTVDEMTVEVVAP